MDRYVKGAALGILAYALIVGAAKYWLHIDVYKWGIVALVALYAGYLVYKKVTA